MKNYICEKGGVNRNFYFVFIISFSFFFFLLFVIKKDGQQIFTKKKLNSLARGQVFTDELKQIK